MTPIFGYALSAFAPAISIGWIISTALNGIARQPEAASALTSLAILGFAVVEALAIFGLVLAFVL